MPDESEEGADVDRPEEPRESPAERPDADEAPTDGDEPETGDEEPPDPSEAADDPDPPEADSETAAETDADEPDSADEPDTATESSDADAETDEPVALEPEPEPGETDPFEPADRYPESDSSGGLEKVDDAPEDDAPAADAPRPPEERESSSAPEPGAQHDADGEAADDGDEAAGDDETSLEPAEADNPRERDDLPSAPDDDVSAAPEDDQPEAKTDGEGVVRDHNEGPAQEPTYPDPDEDIGGISTPPDDQEMPLADHIEEMIMRLAVVLLVGSAFTALGLLWASDAIAIIWADVIPDSELRPPHVYHPLELWLTRIKVAALLGIMAALPMVVYQTYLFMKPGLYPNERKYYLAAVPTSVILAGLGMLFSYFLILPILFRYFTFYSEGSANIAYALGETFNLIITLTGFLAVVFQIPLFIMLAIMMGVTTRRWLADKRLYFWAAFAGLAFMFTMDPTMMAPIFVALTMIMLFEGTLLVLKWVGRE
ncbi:twin-arginine translocase subunit TatC [Natrononativus amylolyticus]|uniref:twin-arginine translocase subunit TatC n=1 Tax=Natrononativus amylolyticus TaxID=2963434 RepID=UPI003CE51BE7